MDALHIVDIAGPVHPGKSPTVHKVVHDLVEPVLEAILVLPDQLDHIRRHLELGILRQELEVRVRGGDIHDQRVAQNQTDRGYTVDLEGADLERLGGPHRLSDDQHGTPQYRERHTRNRDSRSDSHDFAPWRVAWIRPRVSVVVVGDAAPPPFLDHLSATAIVRVKSSLFSQRVRFRSRFSG